MDISQYAVRPEEIDALSAAQISILFRRHKFVTKEECNDAAANITGSTVSPTPIQGSTSYTVTAGTKAVQFRHSALNLEIMEQARKTYGSFVPICKSRGMLAEVHVYEMDLVPGVAFSRARRQLVSPGMEERLLRTVQDFARFFASAWLARLLPEPDLDRVVEIHSHYSGILVRLSQSLPARFLPRLNELREELPLLLRPSYPLVLNHDDLLEMNIHVDKDTGRITGIVDWADSRIAPFGTSLGALETVLGVETSSLWLYHPNHEYLRNKFWETFYEATGGITADDRRTMEAARLFGLFRTYGFDRRPENYDAKPVKEGDQGFVCLEAFCLR